MKSAFPKLGMVLFGLLLLGTIGYFLWSLIFAPRNEVPAAAQEVVRPQMRLKPKPVQAEEAEAVAPLPPSPVPAPRTPVKPPVAAPPVYQTPGK